MRITALLPLAALLAGCTHTTADVEERTQQMVEGRALPPQVKVATQARNTSREALWARCHEAAGAAAMDFVHRPRVQGGHVVFNTHRSVGMRDPVCASAQDWVAWSVVAAMTGGTERVEVEAQALAARLAQLELLTHAVGVNGQRAQTQAR